MIFQKSKLWYTIIYPELLLGVLVSVCSAETYEVTVSTREVREIQACVLGDPNVEVVRICINKRRYGIFYEDSAGYGWYIRPLLYDENHPGGKCACNSFDAKKASDKVQVKRKISTRLVSDEPKGFIRIAVDDSEFRSKTKKSKRNTKSLASKTKELEPKVRLTCVKCP